MPLLVAGVERLVQGVVLVEPGGVLEHDRVDEAAVGGGLEILGAAWVVAREADELALPDFLIASAVSLEFLALGQLERIVGAVVVADAVDEEQVDVVGLQGGEPLVELRDQLLRATWAWSLVTRKISLRTSGIALKPAGDGRLRTVGIGRVEVAEPIGVGEPEQTVGGAPGDFQAPVPRFRIVTSTPVLCPAAGRQDTLGLVLVLAEATPVLSVRAEAAAAAAPVWRNSRRSTCERSFSLISLDSPHKKGCSDHAAVLKVLREMSLPDRVDQLSRECEDY